MFGGKTAGNSYYMGEDFSYIKTKTETEYFDSVYNTTANNTNEGFINWLLKQEAEIGTDRENILVIKLNKDGLSNRIPGDYDTTYKIRFPYGKTIAYLKLKKDKYNLPQKGEKEDIKKAYNFLLSLALVNIASSKDRRLASFKPKYNSLKDTYYKTLNIFIKKYSEKIYQSHTPYENNAASYVKKMAESCKDLSGVTLNDQKTNLFWYTLHRVLNSNKYPILKNIAESGDKWENLEKSIKEISSALNKSGLFNSVEGITGKGLPHKKKKQFKLILKDIQHSTKPARALTNYFLDISKDIRKVLEANNGKIINSILGNIKDRSPSFGELERSDISNFIKIYNSFFGTWANIIREYEAYLDLVDYVLENIPNLDMYAKAIYKLKNVR